MDIVQTNYTLLKHYLKDDGIFPNNALPVLVYKGVLKLPAIFPDTIRKLFDENSWTNSWRYGIYTYHHYHSNTHEVIGVCKGEATLLLGGEKGVEVCIERGDVIVLPAGVAHKNLDAMDNVECIGAYPDGKEYDIYYGKPEERPFTDKNIQKVPIPEYDPVFGLGGPMKVNWNLK
jgi:uncharacterized protein YjlB